MKRKVIGLAKSTHVVSLPNSWLEQNNVKKGDEIEVHEKENSLVIEPKKTEKTISVDVSGLDQHVKRFLNCVYKSGYDEIKVSYLRKEELDKIQEDVNDYLTGFEITKIDEESKKVTIKGLSRIEGKEFDNVLKRIFYIIKQTSSELASGDFDKSVIEKRDKEVNKYSDYCRRILNQNEFLSISSRYKRNPPLYFIVEQLEKIGDDFRDLARINEAKNITHVIRDVNDYFFMLYDFFYKFDRDRFNVFVKRRYELKDKIATMLKYDKKDYTAIVMCQNIIEKSFDMNGPITSCFLE